jgi:hypothetical protein
MVPVRLAVVLSTCLDWAGGRERACISVLIGILSVLIDILQFLYLKFMLERR